MAVPTEVDAQFHTEVEQVQSVDLVGGEGAVVVELGGVVLVDFEHGVAACAVEQVGDAVATIEAHIEAPVVAEGVVEAEVGNDADAFLVNVDITLEVGVVGTETVVGHVLYAVRQGGAVDIELAGVLIRAFLGDILGVQGHVELCTDTDKDEGMLADRRTPVEFHRHAEVVEPLTLAPAVVGGVEVVGQVAVVVVGEAGGGFGEVIQSRGAGMVELHSQSDAEVVAEEVSVAKTGTEAEPQLGIAHGGAVGHAVEASVEVETDIVAVLIALGLGSNGQRQHTKQDEYTFHCFYFIRYCSIYFFMTRTTMPSTLTV